MIEAVRKLWCVVFCLISLVTIYWFIVNLFQGNFVNEPRYFLSTGAFLLVATVVVYLLAFLCRDVLFANLNLSLLAIGIVVACLEIGLRAWDHYDPIFRPAHLQDRFPPVVWRNGFCYYKPGSEGLTHGNVVRINSLGFRGPEYSLAPPPDAYRIIVLGDSYTFGHGVSEDEVYPTLLAEKLNTQFPGKRIEVLNLGVAGASALDEMALLEHFGPLLQPDLVLIGLTGNDVRDGPQIPEHERHRWAIPFPRGPKKFLLSSSMFLKWLSLKYDILLMIVRLRPDYFTSLKRAYDPRSEEWKDFISAYEAMLEWTKRKNMPPPVVGLFITVPYTDPLKNDFINMSSTFLKQQRHIRQIESALNGMGIPTVDFLPFFQHHNKQVRTVSKWEGHPGALAHQLYADGFVDALVGMDVIH